MDSATILKWWHYAGIAATVTGIASQELTPLTTAYPQAAAIVTGLGAISLGITSVMNKLANDKVVAAIINDPSSPTPQGLGIPVPAPTTNPSEVVSSIVSLANGHPPLVQEVATASVAQNVVDHANVILASAKP